jgi:RNA polymerase sigma-70 factor (ECF subfamily)
MHTTPVSLLQELRQPQNSSAWERFVFLYTPLLYSWAQRLDLQAHDAADLLQEVFTLLLRKLPEFKYDPSRSFRGWLRTVLVNKCRELHRPHQITEQDGAERAGDDPAQLFEEDEYRGYLVGRALELMQANFEPTTWKACWESVVADRPAADVAQELGISVNAVYLAKSRVLRRLHQQLDELLD